MKKLILITLLLFTVTSFASTKKCSILIDSRSIFVSRTEPYITEGLIEGSLTYPSEGIPKDIIVCAQNLKSKKLICTKDHLKSSKYIYGIGYIIPVPSGKYRILSIRYLTYNVAYYKKGNRDYNNCTKFSVVEIVPGVHLKKIDLKYNCGMRSIESIEKNLFE